MVKADKWIAKYIIGDHDDDCINPASLDLRLGNQVTQRFSGSNADVAAKNWSNLPDGHRILLQSGIQWLLCTEPVYLGDTQAGLFTLKSSMGRRGLFLSHPGWIDPGYEGAITFSVMVHFPVLIVIGERIGQIIYLQMEEIPRKVYGDTGRYQHSTGVVQEKHDAQEKEKKE